MSQSICAGRGERRRLPKLQVVFQSTVVDRQLSKTVQDFVTQHIVSVEELELLLVFQAERERQWSVAELNTRIRSQEASVANRMAALVDRGLVARVEGAVERYRFAPATPLLEQQVAALAADYGEWRIRIVELIYSKPTDQLRKFAGAFNLKKHL
jgi:predicted transcriptional regulator